jgi:hypothetical protein
VDQREPPTRRSGLDRRSNAQSLGAGTTWEGDAVLVRMEECLARLDRLGWTLAAAQLSQAVETVRERIVWARIEENDGAEGVSL